MFVSMRNFKIWEVEILTLEGLFSKIWESSSNVFMQIFEGGWKQALAPFQPLHLLMCVC